jgi:hypothetical protein
MERRMRASIALTIGTELVQGKVEVEMIRAGMAPGQRARDRMGICRQMPSFAVPGGLSPLSGGGKRARGSRSGARVTGAAPSARAGSEGLGGGGGGFAFVGGELGGGGDVAEDGADDVLVGEWKRPGLKTAILNVPIPGPNPSTALRARLACLAGSLRCHSHFLLLI